MICWGEGEGGGAGCDTGNIYLLNGSEKWTTYLDKVHEDISEALHVVPPALLYAKVGVDAGVAGRPRQVLVFSVGDVLVGPGVPVLFGQTEVDDIDQVPFLTQAPGMEKRSPIR